MKVEDALQNMGEVKNTYTAASPTKPYWLCSTFSGAVLNNSYSLFSAQPSSPPHAKSCTILTHCCTAINVPTENICILFFLFLH